MPSQVPPGSPRRLQLTLLLLFAWVNTAAGYAQVDYSVHMEMEKPQDILGEPLFCRYVIRNTGKTVFAFRYRTPTRSLAADYDQEPRFVVTDAEGRRLPDPGPQPCGGRQGTTVYGSVTLPPGQVHIERWLLNQWAQISSPGRYRVRAERRLALYPADSHGGKFEDKPLAFALALDELSVQEEPDSPAEVEAAFRPYLAAVQDPKNPNPAEAVVVLTSLPQPFFLNQLAVMAHTGQPERWDRRDALDGLARLGTPASWNAILEVFRSTDGAGVAERKDGGAQGEDALRSYALLLLAEKGDPASLPALLDGLSTSGEPMRGDILRALGFFNDGKAFQTVYTNLHSAQVSDRMNALLGLKNLGRKEAMPALLAALDDPEPQVRAVANFALEGLTGYKVGASTNPTGEDPAHLASDWHAWWRNHAATFSPPPPPACHEW